MYEKVVYLQKSIMPQSYIVGMYYPGDGYYHKCAFPKCYDPYFFGRKNQLYHTDCKKRMDAERLAAKREKTKEENKLMEYNLKILERYYPTSLGINEIPSIELRREGFDFNSPSRRIKTKKYGHVCHIVHGYAFQYIKERDTIIIYKKDELHRI